MASSNVDGSLITQILEPNPRTFRIIQIYLKAYKKILPALRTLLGSYSR